MARLESGSKEMARSPLPYSKEPFLYCSKEILDIFKIKWPFSEEKLIYRGGGVFFRNIFWQYDLDL